MISLLHVRLTEAQLSQKD